MNVKSMHLNDHNSVKKIDYMKAAMTPTNQFYADQEHDVSAQGQENAHPHVLVVEDNPMAMNIAVLMLENENCIVFQAHNATQALRLSQNQTFDFILSDIGLPDFSGFMLAKRIHEYQRQHGIELTPIIGLTAHAKKDALAQENCLEMIDICEKPLRMEALHPFIVQYAPKGTVPPSHLESNQNEYYMKLPLFDVSAIEKQLGNSRIMKNVIRYMLEHELPDMLAQMHQAYRMQDAQYLAKIMHRFKSSCLYCGTVRLLKITQRVEQAMENAPKSRKTEVYQAFQQIAQDTRQVLHQWLNA